MPKKGEIIVYSDGGGVGVPKIKVGDGTTKVGNLKFITIDSNADLSINGTPIMVPLRFPSLLNN